MELDLWLQNRLVARTATDSRGRVRIKYTDDELGAHPAETPLLSCSLPTPGPSGPANARAFLEGLLPEGRALEAAASKVREVALVDGSPADTTDAVALLAEYGWDCAGAVVALPAGMTRNVLADRSYQLLDDDGVAGLIDSLQRRPLGTDLDRDIRMSLAGAQPKLLLARIDGDWHEPIAGAPSTHILKPAGGWPNSVHNESLVMAIARDTGLSTQDSWVETFAGIEVFVTERYDRCFVDGHVERMHQEDMCQASGLRPRDKYRIGNPGLRMAAVLREFADDPRAAALELYRQVAFRCAVGDEDGHGKNYSIMLDDGSVRLAPLYDSLCTIVYTALDGKMGAKVGDQIKLAKVNRAALCNEAEKMGLTVEEADDALTVLARDMLASLNRLPARHLEGWPSGEVVDVIGTRLERLGDGSPLGGP